MSRNQLYKAFSVIILTLFLVTIMDRKAYSAQEEANKDLH